MNLNHTPAQRPAEEKIALLLELMGNPTTAWTTQEVWCRVDAWGGDRLVPILLTHLESIDSNIVILVLNVLRFQIELASEHNLKDHVDEFVRMLRHEDRLVRQAAIYVLGDLGVVDDKVTTALQHVMSTDEPYFAAEAAIAVLTLKPDEASNLMPYLIEILDGDDMLLQLVVLNGVESLGKRAEELLPHIIKLLDEVEDEAALAILKITGDESYARRVVEKWRQEEDQEEPKVRQLAAKELEDEIERIRSNTSLRSGDFLFTFSRSRLQ